MTQVTNDLVRIAVLDDYQDVSTSLADWSVLGPTCEVTVFRDHLRVPDEAAERLRDFDIICLVRERMAVPRELIERLPRLKFIAATGPHNRTVDFTAAAERGILVSHTAVKGNISAETVELTWGLILALARNLVAEERSMRAGGWQVSLGTRIRGKTLALLGLGRLGVEVARVAHAFGVKVIAWSENLTQERADEAGVERVTREELFRRADFLSIHLVLGERSRGVVGAVEFAMMKPTAFLVNTARGPIVREADLIDALRSGAIAGAAIDVYDEEPLPVSHPLRTVPNALLTPHLGYVTDETLISFYRETVENIQAFLEGAPIRLLTSYP